MKTYFLLFIVATFSSLVLTPVVRRLCQRWRWLDEPKDERRLHRKAIPRLGGVAVFGSVLVGLLPLLLIDNLFTAALRESAAHVWVILLPASLTLLLGAFDDLHGLSARHKFGGLALIGVIFYVMGGRIEELTLPFVGSIALPATVSLILTVVWIVSITNAFNLLDGMDGLATGAAFFSSLVIMGVSLMQGRPFVIAVALVLSGALIGFLRYNFNPASIFLGDSGALFVGFMLAALSVEGTQKASTAVAVAIPIMAFGLPVLDTGFTIVRRFISRKPLFEGDREHIHHMLLDRGWSQKRTALVLYCVCAVFGMLTLLFVGNSGHVTGLVLFIIGVAIMVAVSQLKYHEIEEFKAGVRRNVGDRRLRGEMNISVRRASRSLAKANTLGELFGAVVEIVEAGEFVRAVMIVGRCGEATWNESVLARELEVSGLRGAEMRDERIWWSWANESVQGADLPAANYWILRLPLSAGNDVLGHLNLYRAIGMDGTLMDINYLCTSFHHEVAHAVERILEKPVEDERELALAMRA